MFIKSVTLDVSKLSGWLNAGVYCQESKGGHAVCGARSAGQQAVGGGRPRGKQRAGEDSTTDWEQSMGRSAPRTCSSWP